MSGDLMKVTRADQTVMELPVERIPLDYPGLDARGEACMGRTSNGDIWAAVGFNTGAPGVEFQRSPERLFRSTDGGRTWTSRPLAPTGKERMCAFIVLADDAFLLAVGLAVDQIEVYRSDDYGVTWEGPAIMAADPYQRIGEGFESMTQTAGGTVLLPVSRQTDNAGERPRRESLAFRSADGGRSWGDPSPTFDNVGEPHIIQLQSGNLLGAFRHQRSVSEDDPQEFIERWGVRPFDKRWVINPADPGGQALGLKHVFVGESEDDGRTWKDLRPLRTEGGEALLDFGECHGQLVQVPDGRVVLVHDRRYPRNTGSVRARVSHDEGRTWQPEVYHVSFGAGYPASVALEDGTIVTVTGNTPLDDRPRPIGPWSVQAVRWRLPEK